MGALRAVMFFASLGVAAPAASAPLVADLSSDEIRITAQFSGTNLLLFGAIERKGDIVVIVRGPRRPETVRRKERIAGVWVNGSAVRFTGVPGYYFIASNRPLSEIAEQRTLEKLGLGIDLVPFVTAAGISAEQAAAFRAGLIRLKEREGLFTTEPAPVRIVDNRLFRTDLTFPSSVPTGRYDTDVFLFRDGKLISRRQTPLMVHKTGIEAAIFDFAHTQSAIYGICAILFALLAGWLAGAIFRKA